jgi:lipopolysaccharide biosynthesis glycosyltransferase
MSRSVDLGATERRGTPSLLALDASGANTSRTSAPSADKERISVLFCCDPGYYQHLAVALVSLLENNRNNTLDIHLISSGKDPMKEAWLSASTSRYHNFNLNTYYFNIEDLNKWHTSYHIKGEAYIRLFAPSILPKSLEKILYLDVDLIVIDDLSDLWKTDLGNYALAAAPDPFGASRRGPLGIPNDACYVNSGVLLLNLAKWRSDNLSARLADYIEREGSNLLFHDQDAINAVLHPAIKSLSYRWNYQAKMLRLPRFTPLADLAAIREAGRSPAIIHYTSARKPWLFVMAMPAKRLYRRYLAMTEWRSAPLIGRTWYSLPEFCTNHILYYAGIDYTWDRILRSTTVGRIIDRLIRLLAGPRKRSSP